MRMPMEASAMKPNGQSRSPSGIDSVRMRGRVDGSDDPIFLEVAVLDSKRPSDLELAIVRGDKAVWAIVDLNDLLSAIQVMRSTAEHA
jgi:hypothetical protein